MKSTHYKRLEETDNVLILTHRQFIRRKREKNCLPGTPPAFLCDFLVRWIFYLNSKLIVLQVRHGTYSTRVLRTKLFENGKKLLILRNFRYYMSNIEKARLTILRYRTTNASDTTTHDGALTKWSEYYGCICYSRFYNTIESASARGCRVKRAKICIRQKERPF